MLFFNDILSHFFGTISDGAFVFKSLPLRVVTPVKLIASSHGMEIKGC
jgi:hypothetical protein